MLTHRRVQAPFSVVLLAGCSAINPQIDQLQTFKRQAAEGNWDAIATAQISCSADVPGCAQLQQIKADACLLTVDNVAAADRVRRYDCAIQQYDAALQANMRKTDRTVDPARLLNAELRALGGRRDISRSQREAAPFNTRMLSLAQDTISTYPGQSSGYYYLATGLLAQGLTEVPPERCRTFDRVAAVLNKAAAMSGAAPDAIAQRRRDVANAGAGQC